jgi:cell division septal protein FtsQ
MRKRTPGIRKTGPLRKRPFVEWLQGRPKSHSNRRSKARLGEHKRTVPGFKAAVLNPAQTTLHVKGNAILNILFLTLLGWAAIWFFASDRFYIDHVTVTGNRRVSTEAILQASGLQGYSIFWVNARKVAHNIAESFPPVKRVRVQYGLPNIARLVIEEQDVQVMWQIAENPYWVEDDGHLYPVQGEAMPNILVIDIRPNLPDRIDPEAVLAARQLSTLLPELKVIEYAPITGLRFTHPRGWVVYLGTGKDMARKVSILQAIEAQFDPEGEVQPTLVDLRFPDTPYYRLSEHVERTNDVAAADRPADRFDRRLDLFDHHSS